MQARSSVPWVRKYGKIHGKVRYVRYLVVGLETSPRHPIFSMSVSMCSGATFCVLLYLISETLIFPSDIKELVVSWYTFPFSEALKQKSLFEEPLVSNSGRIFSLDSRGCPVYSCFLGEPDMSRVITWYHSSLHVNNIGATSPPMFSRYSGVDAQ